MRAHVYVVDIGSPRHGLAWARVDGLVGARATGGVDLRRLAKRIAASLNSGVAVAIGLEAPGFLPVPVDPRMLAKARDGEIRDGISRPWSYGPGAYATAIAIQVGAWLLHEVSVELGWAKPPSVTLDPEEWQQEATVLLWEAFVSGSGHARASNAAGVSEHVQDAATAALAFLEWWSRSRPRESAVSCERCISTLGTVALWAGWATDVRVLSQMPIVLWPNEPLGYGVTPDDVVGSDALEPVVAVSSDESEDETAQRATLSVRCGDSHSLWRNHQGPAEAEQFELLVRLLGAAESPVRECEVSFDSGVTWKQLALRLVSKNQICWRGHSARASASNLVELLVRP